MKNYITTIALSFITCFISGNLSARVNCDSDTTIINTLCSGYEAPKIINGTTYDEDNPYGVEVISNYLGCDSTITIYMVYNTSVIPTPNVTYTEDSLCMGNTTFSTDYVPNYIYRWRNYSNPNLYLIGYPPNNPPHDWVEGRITSSVSLWAGTNYIELEVIDTTTLSCSANFFQLSLELPNLNITYSEDSLCTGYSTLSTDYLPNCMYKWRNHLDPNFDTNSWIEGEGHITSSVPLFSGNNLIELEVIDTLATYCISSTQTINIFVGIPDLNIIYPQDTVCLGSTITFSADSLSNCTYKWQNHSDPNFNLNSWIEGHNTSDIELFPGNNLISLSVIDSTAEYCSERIDSISVQAYEILSLSTFEYDIDTVYDTCGLNTGQIDLSLNPISVINPNSTALYDYTQTYEWSNGSTSQSISGLQHGHYTVSIIRTFIQSIDINDITLSYPIKQCAIVGARIHKINSNTEVSLSSDLSTLNCEDQIATLSASATDTLGLVSQFMYFFEGEDSPTPIQIDSITATVDTAGTYIVNVEDEWGCITSDTLLIEEDPLEDCIYPGDANLDFIVNNQDILAICMGMGNTGPERNTMGVEWNSHYGEDWEEESFPNVNDKHSDCNGDGTINQLDLAACNINYNAQYDGTLPPPNTDNTTTPIVRLEYNGPYFSNDGSILVIGDIIIEGIDGGEVEDFYGIAFSLAYDTTYVKEGSPMIAYDNNSWMGTSEEVVVFLQDSYQQGIVDIAISRNNQIPVTGSGIVAQFQIIIEDDLISRPIEEGEDSYYNVNTNIINTYSLDSGGNEIPFNSITDNILVYLTTTSNPNIIQNEEIDVYPNPSQDELFINTKDIIGKRYTIHNTFGQEVIANNINDKVTSIDIKTLETGVYFLRIETDKGSSTIKILKE